MFHNYQNTRSYVVGLFLASTLSLACLGCDKLLPAKFKAQNFNAADVDLRAGTLMTKDTINDAQGNTIFYQYIPGPPVTHYTVKWDFIGARILKSFSDSTDTTDSQIIHSKFSMLTDSLPSLASDMLVLVRYPGDTVKNSSGAYPGDTISVCYAVLRCAQPEDIYLYTGLEYYYASGVSNVADYVSVDLLKADTSLVTSSTAVPATSTYASTETILVASNATEVVPALAARYAFHLDSGAYIVRFTLSNPLEISNPQAVPKKGSGAPAISDEFKVVILPQ